MPEESTSSNPCFVGGRQALYSSARILKELGDASDFADIDKVVKETAEGLKGEERVFASKDIKEQIAEAMVRARLYGGDPDVYLQILRTADLNNPEVVATFSDLMLRQQVTFHGMNAVKGKMASLSKKITDGVESGVKEVDIESLEMQLVNAKAQFRNYVAYNSTLGTGAGRLLAQRKSKNLLQSLDLITKNLDEVHREALDGEVFLRRNEVNANERTKMQDSVDKIDDELSSDLDAISNEDFEARIKSDDEIINLKEQSIANIEADIKARKAQLKESGNKQKGDKFLESQNAKLKEQKQELYELQSIRELRSNVATVRRTRGDVPAANRALRTALEQLRKQLRGKIKASEIKTKEDYALFAEQSLGSKKVRTFAKRFHFASQAGTQEEILHMAAQASKQTGWTKGLNMSLQWFMGSILSGPPSVVLNGVSAALSRTLMRLERFSGALLGGDPELVKAAMTFDASMASIKKAGKLALMSLKSGKDEIIGGARAFDEEKGLGAFHSSNFKSRFMNSDPMVQVMNTVNFLTRLPFRINGSVDVINKSLAIDNYLNTHYRMKGLQAGLSGNDLGDYIDKNVRKMYNEDGSLFSEERMTAAYAKKAAKEGYDEADPMAIPRKHAQFIEGKLADIGDDFSEMDALARRAEAFARESTFTGESGQLTNLLNKAREQQPLLKFLLPFVNTPMQVLNFGWRRTLPGVLLHDIAPMLMSKQSKARLAYEAMGPMEKAAYRGRITTAVASTAAMVYYASANRDFVTGGGPRNPKERKALEATGWRPYSFVLTDDEGNKTYISYQRLDPFATMIGLVADIAEFGDMNPNSDDNLIEAGSSLAFTIAENMTDKSFLRGVNNVINIFSEPEVYGPKTVRDIASAMAVPMFIDKIKSTEGEQLIRENRTIVDAILRKLPIAEEMVAPKRTFLGEEVYKQNPLGLLGIANPFYVASKKNDIVDEKIESMLYGFDLPESKYLKSPDTDMREFYNEDGRQAYDRFMELSSTVEMNGQNLRSALKSLFKSNFFKNAEMQYELNVQSGMTGADDPRVKITKNVISRYRAMAKRQVITEFPELQRLVTKIQQHNIAQRQQIYNPIPSL